jgi:hypothetical protein
MIVSVRVDGCCFPDCCMFICAFGTRFLELHRGLKICSFILFGLFMTLHELSDDCCLFVLQEKNPLCLVIQLTNIYGVS